MATEEQAVSIDVQKYPYLLIGPFAEPGPRYMLFAVGVREPVASFGRYIEALSLIEARWAQAGDSCVWFNPLAGYSDASYVTGAEFREAERVLEAEKEGAGTDG